MSTYTLNEDQINFLKTGEKYYLELTGKAKTTTIPLHWQQKMDKLHQEVYRRKVNISCPDCVGSALKLLYRLYVAQTGQGSPISSNLDKPITHE